MKKNLNIAVLFIISLLLINIFTKGQAEADGKSSYQEFLDGKAVIIDVREADEIKDGMIKGALWIPLSKIQNDPENEMAKIKNLATNKSIYLYCRSGNRSGKVKSLLETKKIKSINLGGFSTLQEELIPTQKGL